ncbi:retropepsin-like domain-containing protein [Candidatus Woesearchaeota archaeon]|nr:retropepsin-like domain-containing protein [Candidatus Woesearchaeota archaeon]HLC80675.1 retropepsin-like aspartic protease [Candidatus Nanoarchaeia archaeon]
MIFFDYKEINGKFYPAIPVILKVNEREIKIHAIIDSGSEISLFDKNLAERLGINYQLTRDIKNMNGVSGRLLVYIHQLTITVGDKTFSCRIGFFDERTTSHNLLGRQGFFENFKITFDEKNKKIFRE